MTTQAVVQILTRSRMILLISQNNIYIYHMTQFGHTSQPESVTLYKWAVQWMTNTTHYISYNKFWTASSKPKNWTTWYCEYA